MAVPIDRVQRVLKEFTPQGMLEGGRGLVRINSETIAIVDLSMMFFSSPEQRDREYLIICTLAGGDSLRNSSASRFAIPTADMPTILEAPLDQFTDIPELYRQGFSGTASAIANAALEKLIHAADGKIVFYLNLEQLFSHLPAL